MKWYERISSIDRRIIYGLLTLCIILPFFISITIKQNIMPQTRKLFNYIDTLPADNRVVMISFDYTPQTVPEVHPMGIALLKHCFARNIPVVGLTFDPQGPGLAVDAFTTVIDIFNQSATARTDSIIYGEDCVYLGWKSGRVAAMLQMGESITDVFPRDYWGTPVDSLPLMERVRTYKNVAIVINLAAAAYPDDWIRYPQSRYGVRVAAGLTAVMAPKYYPYLQTGQLTGMMSGMKGAAEYENLIYHKGYAEELGRAETGMNSQSLVHLLIIVFIIFGNIGYFFSRRKKR